MSFGISDSALLVCNLIMSNLLVVADNFSRKTLSAADSSRVRKRKRHGMQE